MSSSQKNVKQIKWPDKNLKVSLFFVMLFERNRLQKKIQGAKLESYMKKK